MVVVFVLCGVWHGTSWTFVIWGLYHGAFIVLERAGLASTIKQLPTPLRHVYLIVVVMIGWVFFRAESVLAALTFLNALVGLQTSMAPVFALQPRPEPLLLDGPARGPDGVGPARGLGEPMAGDDRRRHRFGAGDAVCDRNLHLVQHPLAVFGVRG